MYLVAISALLPDSQTVGRAAYAYVVDPRGQVLASSTKGPDIARDLTDLPQVAAVLALDGHADVLLPSTPKRYYAPDGGSRVSLDSVIYHYRHGATAEEIALRFPGLRLADIHSCISYCLNHQEEVDDYLANRERSAAALRERLRGSGRPYDLSGRR